MKHSVLILAVALGVLQSGAADGTDGNEKGGHADAKAVFQFGGPGGSLIDYRIPAVATVENGLNKGRVILFNDYRYGHGDIGSGRIDIYQAVSDDNGKTWSAPQPMLNAKGEPVASGDGWSPSRCAFGDAAVVSDRTTGKLLVLSAGGDNSFFYTTHEWPMSCYTWTSTDGGDSWSGPVDMTGQMVSLLDARKGEAPAEGYFFASGRIAQSGMIRKGDYYRIYSVMTVRTGERDTSNWVFYSDDFGANWSVLGDAPAVAKYGDEAKVEELPDGSVLLSGRGMYGDRNFNIFRYKDALAATGKWDKPVKVKLGDGGDKLNACNGELLAVKRQTPDGETQWVLLQSFVNSDKRERVSIAWKVLGSADDYDSVSDMKKWDGVYEVTGLPSAYSTMTVQPDGRIGIAYEESTYGRDYTTQYVNLTLDQIMGK